MSKDQPVVCSEYSVVASGLRPVRRSWYSWSRVALVTLSGRVSPEISRTRADR
jgi:hypothetical protein